MWRSPDRGRGREVTCIACGETVPRSKAREYDSKPCDRDRCHQPRSDLEAVLEDAEAAADGEESFVGAYLDLAERHDESVEER
ncbi:hypothetical protein BRC60_00705 [Halobacteriales archaeon QH_1_68_42]|nr:MAG: hypothetical protein BRC60_00705 [Halobacteriales archaeon QH_1_68_42]